MKATILTSLDQVLRCLPANGDGVSFDKLHDTICRETQLPLQRIHEVISNGLTTDQIGYWYNEAGEPRYCRRPVNTDPLKLGGQ
jgi:hypothetical protein